MVNIPQSFQCGVWYFFQQTGHESGMVANPACGQLNRENGNFPVFVRAWEFGLGELGLAVPSRVSPLILHTQAESGTYLRDSALPSRFPLRVPVEPCAIGLVPSLSSHAIELRRSLPRTGKGPVVLNKYTPLFSHTHYWYSGHVLQSIIPVWYLSVLNTICTLAYYWYFDLQNISMIGVLLLLTYCSLTHFLIFSALNRVTKKMRTCFEMRTDGLGFE